MGRKSRERLKQEDIELLKLKIANPDLVNDINRLSKITSSQWGHILPHHPNLYQYCSTKIKKGDLLKAFRQNPHMIYEIKGVTISFSEFCSIMTTSLYDIFNDDVLLNEYVSRIVGNKPYYSLSYLIRSKFTHLDKIWDIFNKEIMSSFNKLYFKTKFLLFMGGKVPKESISYKEWKYILSIGDRYFHEVVYEDQLFKYISSTVKTLSEDDVRECLKHVFSSNNKYINSYTNSLFRYSTSTQDINTLINDHYTDVEILKHVDLNKIGNFGIDYITVNEIITKIDFSHIRSQRIKFKILYNIASIYGGSYSAQSVNTLRSIRWDTLKGKNWNSEIISLMKEHGTKENARLVMEKLNKKYITVGMYHSLT